MVFLGLEAEEVDALAEVNKQLNLRRGVESYEEAFRRIHRAGIAVLGAFIFGMDGDTPEKLRHRAEYMVRSRIDVMQKTFLTPLPGTRLFDRLQDEGRLLHTSFPRDWERYDMGEAIHRPRGMAPETLAQVMGEVGRGPLAAKLVSQGIYHVLVDAVELGGVARLDLRVFVKETDETFSSAVEVVSNNVGPGFGTDALGMGLRFQHAECELRALLDQLCRVRCGSDPRRAEATPS